jgi:methylisocitrate lyase
MPVICDPFGARLARDAGYEAVALPGCAIGAHQPLTCPLSVDTIEHAARAVVRACDIPLLLDADVGWGGGGEVAAAVTRLEAAGVAAIQLTSHSVPDHVPVSLAAERGRARAELVRRIETACGARHHALVVARCDAVSGSGYAEWLEQASALLAAGADAIALHATGDDVRRLPRDLPGAALIFTGPPAAGRAPSAFSPYLLGRWGYSAVSNKYHGCYCVRRQPPTRRIVPAVRRAAG